MGRVLLQVHLVNCAPPDAYELTAADLVVGLLGEGNGVSLESMSLNVETEDGKHVAINVTPKRPGARAELRHKWFRRACTRDRGRTQSFGRKAQLKKRWRAD